MKKGDINFTEGQKELIVKMEAFLNSSEKIFLLTGKPGVGKTFMTQYILREHIKADKGLSPSNVNINVAGITLSHAAKKVLGEHIPRVFTFAKCYGMKESVDEETGLRHFIIDKYNKDKICIGDMNIPVFVHDEVSVYTQEMLNIVFERTPMFSKIILMGDRAQLPPIDTSGKMPKDSDSPVFSLDIPEECKHELTERVRQAKGNPILDLSDEIREEIFGNQNINRILKLISKPKMENDMGWGILKYSELYEHIEKRPDLSKTLIAYRNKTVKFFNDKIRNYLLKNPDDILVDDDVVCMTDNFYAEGVDGHPLYVLHNSEVFKLKKVYKQVYKHKIAGVTYNIDCFVANIENRSEQFIAPTESGYQMYQEALQEVANKCREREISWNLFWKFKDIFCKYIYGYCITAYKVQGSTYDRIYVDINDIMLTGPLTPKRQLQTIYTAITRARGDVYFLKGR